MKYVCERCAVTTEELDEMPDKCSTCGADSEKLSLVIGDDVPNVEVIAEEKIEEIRSFGIRSTPEEIRRILKLITIPTGENPYEGFQKVNLRITPDKVINYQIAPGQVLLTVLELDRDYFTEVNETGDMVLNTAKSLSKMKVLSAYDEASIQVDNENKVILHRAGKVAGFSDNLEDASHVLTSKDEMPVPFDSEAFKPKIDEDSPESEYLWHVSVDADAFKPLFEVTKESKIDYYPLAIEDGELKTGVGDMENPGMEGAFKLSIPIEAKGSVLPEEKILVEVGGIFKNVMMNLSGGIRIYFAGNELPLWIEYDIAKNVTEDDKRINKSFGTMGYIIPPRS